MSLFRYSMIWKLFLRKIAGLLNVVSEEEEMDNQDTLSQREKEIVICVVKGMTNKEIAEKLFVDSYGDYTPKKY